VKRFLFRALGAAVVLAACGRTDAETPGFAQKSIPTLTTVAPTTTTEASTTTAPPVVTAAPRPATTARRTPATTRPRATVTTRPGIPIAPASTTPAIPSEAPRATVGATVTYSGGGDGWAAYLNLHDAHSNAIAIGGQSDTGDSGSNGRPMLHANRVINGHFDHAYGATQLTAGETHRWELRYYEKAGQALFFRDGAALLSIGIKLVGRVFYQTEVNCKNDGDSVDATFNGVRIGGIKGDGSPVLPNGVWNTTDFDFWRLDMRQTNDVSVVQGANVRGGGTIGGMGSKDWHTASPPAAAIAMITEQQ
jgi:hypothetical protein